MSRSIFALRITKYQEFWNSHFTNIKNTTRICTIFWIMPSMSRSIFALSITKYQEFRNSHFWYMGKTHPTIHIDDLPQCSASSPKILFYTFNVKWWHVFCSTSWSMIINWFEHQYCLMIGWTVTLASLICKSYGKCSWKVFWLTLTSITGTGLTNRKILICKQILFGNVICLPQ